MDVPVIWQLLCGCLIFFMQAGFTCYEAGFVQSKNVISVTIENLLTFGITVILYVFVGAPLMFGSFAAIWNVPQNYLFLFVQAMFAAVSVTIFAGAMSERTKLVPLLLASFCSAALIYPVFGHWVWAGRMGGHAWLAELGFIDFAGASVVHLTAGCIALAGLLVTGSRKNRGAGRSNIPLATLGVFILWFGWLGFNVINCEQLENVGLVCINTMLSATTGMGGAIMVIVVSRKKGGYLISSFNGVLAGLVAITAISEYCTPIGAAILGLIAGISSELIMKLVTNKTVDDVVNVIPTHLCGGIVGCLLAPFLVAPAYLHHGVFTQFAVQLLGVAVNIAWAFTSAYLMFHLIDKVVGLRVSSEEEDQGLNIVEFNDIYSWEKYIEISSYESQIREKNRLLRKQSRLLVVTEEQEKNNLAKELHDGVGQSLAALKLLLKLNLKYAQEQGDEKLAASAAQAVKLADSSISEIRNVLNDLRPQYLERGLSQGLQFMVDNLDAIEGFHCTLQTDDPIPEFDDTISLNIYRLLQEALTNVVRHAKASEAMIVCRQLSESYYFEVRDNGIGFDLAKVEHGVGLDSMSDRIKMLGGAMQIHTKPGEGTTVTMEVPLYEQ